MIIKAEINYTITRTNAIDDIIWLFEDDGCQIPLDYPAHDEIRMDIRHGKRESAELLTSLSSLDENEPLSIVEGYGLRVNTGAIFTPSKKYFYDIVFIIDGVPVTYYYGAIVIDDNVTAIPTEE